MEIPAFVLAFLILTVEVRGNEKRQTGPECLQCLKVAEAHDCETVTTCEADEECFTEQYITQEGHIFFDLGCKSKQICDAIHKFGKRSKGQPQSRQSDGRITLCEECCSTERSCNGKGCDTYNSTRRLCYTCSGEQSMENPNDCSTVTMCEAHEQCYQAYGLTNELQLRYAMGCILDRTCNVMYSSGGPTLGHPGPLSRPGRVISEIYERDHLKREMGDPYFKRQVRPDGSPMFTVTSCEYCCNNSYCNKNECINGVIRTAPPTTHAPMTPPTTHAPTTQKATQAPTTIQHTNAPMTHAPTISLATQKLTTHAPPTSAYTTHILTTHAPTTHAPIITTKPTTHAPITPAPTLAPTTQKLTTHAPTTHAPTITSKPTTHAPITPAPTTQKLTTHAPTTHVPTVAPTTPKQTTHVPITPAPTSASTTHKPTTHAPTTQSPTTKPTTPAHLTCLECTYISHEMDCNHTSVCDSGEICYLGRLDATELNNNYCFYSTGCMQKTECDGYHQQLQGHSKVSVRGDDFEYFECCAKSLCNEHNVNPKPAYCHPMPDATTPKH